MQSVPELGSLRNELRLAGVFNHQELRSWLKLALLLGGTAACLVTIAMYGWYAALFLVPVCSVLCTAAAMMGHEGSHRSTSKSPTRNSFMAYFAFPLLSGLSALYWREKHDRLHHGHPNVEGVDPDIRPFPFASTNKEHLKCGPKERWFQRTFQKWAFWPMSTLMTLGMRRSSLLHVYRYPKKHGFTKDWWIDVACQVTHYTAWLVIPSLIWGPLVAFLLYSAIWAGVGVFLALVFLPAHAGLPIVAEQNNDWIHQLETTRNLQLPKFISFFFIGLDYQAEHHLFPKIPHQHLPKAAAITKAWCERHGVVYLSVPYLHALVDAAKFMADGWQREASDPIEVRAGLVGMGRLAA
ncbi:MAG: acyl-CoA desaturase [Deltaproteobacteria bacterium]|nr:acyl-CoA desaturase [Deltaproteobacteria bacterium]